MSKANPKPSARKALDFGSVLLELNLAMAPVFLLTDRQRADGSVRTIYSDKMEIEGRRTAISILVTGIAKPTESDIVEIERAKIIRNSAHGDHEGTDANEPDDEIATVWGLPTDSDRSVWLALLQLAAEQGWPEDRKVHFTVGQLAAKSGKSKSGGGGREYQRVRDAMHRLHGVSIVYDSSWYDKAAKKHRSTEPFRLLDKYAVLSSQGKMSHAVVAQEIWDSIRARYFTVVDMTLYHELGTPMARALYEYLARWLGQAEPLRVGLTKLGARLNVVKGTRPARIKQYIDDAVLEMRARGIAVSVEHQDGQSGPLVVFDLSAGAREKRAVVDAPAKAKAPTPVQASLLDQEPVATEDAYTAQATAELEQDLQTRGIKYCANDVSRRTEELKRAARQAGK